MTKRQKLEKLLALIDSGRKLGREFDKTFVEDTDGRHVSIKDPAARDAIQRRLAEVSAQADTEGAA